MLFSGLAALLGVYVSGNSPAKGLRIGLSAIHGVGLLLILVSGFGMAARLGIFAALPMWLILKLLIWLFLGASVAFAKRKAQWGVNLILVWIALGALAGYLALFKPV